MARSGTKTSSVVLSTVVLSGDRAVPKRCCTIIIRTVLERVMKPKHLLAVPCIAFILAFVGCKPTEPAVSVYDKPPVVRQEHQSSEALSHACILSYNTDFKLALVDRLVEELLARKVSVLIDDMADGSGHSATEYDVVVLLSGIEAFRPLPEAAEYIEANDYADNIVYFFTYTVFSFPYGLKIDRRKVDAITSASISDDGQTLDAAESAVMSKVDAILSR